MSSARSAHKSFRTPLNLLLLAFWVLLIGAGYWRLFVYSNTPGATAQASVYWPEQSILGRDNSGPSLLVFAHPRCPCSKATLGELERMLPRLTGKAKISVVFVKPPGLHENWEREALWKKAVTLPGVQVILDDGGQEAKKFDAQTSGQTFLYSADGKLVFNGGITPERGHMGDSAGKEAVLSYIQSGELKVATTPVFGCSLLNPERAFAAESHHDQH